MTPYQEGVEAFKNKESSFNNPYNEGTPEFVQWENGWNDEWIRTRDS